MRVLKLWVELSIEELEVVVLALVATLALGMEEPAIFDPGFEPIAARLHTRLRDLWEANVNTTN